LTDADFRSLDEPKSGKANVEFILTVSHCVDIIFRSPLLHGAECPMFRKK
jgi:hypothetical protein